MSTLKVAILVSGILRSFKKELWNFLQLLPDNYDVYISTPNSVYDTDRYWNPSYDIDDIASHKKVKFITIENDKTISDPKISQREKNSIYQWRRIQSLFAKVPSSYDVYVRCRPDVKIEINIPTFISLMEHLEANTIYIPEGFNIYDSSVLPKSELDFCINDQFAFGNYKVMSHYCNLINEFDYTPPIISERLLYTHLRDLIIKRVPLKYKLSLSECFSIAICGDSGVGKSYISNIISKVFPFDKHLVFETDRYHKWERGDDRYNKYTHLNPEANNIELLANDAYNLLLGSDIYAVDYDHSTGKFTNPEIVEAAPYLIVCGLHTLYKDSIRDIFDIKIYVEADEALRIHWKLCRDTTKRCATPQNVIETIKKREKDYISYILPQRDHANIIINHKLKSPTDLDTILLEITLIHDFALLAKSDIEKVCSCIEYNQGKVKFIFEETQPDGLKNDYDAIITNIFKKILWKS